MATEFTLDTHEITCAQTFYYSPVQGFSNNMKGSTRQAGLRRRATRSCEFLQLLIRSLLSPFIRPNELLKCSQLIDSTKRERERDRELPQIFLRSRARHAQREEAMTRLHLMIIQHENRLLTKVRFWSRFAGDIRSAQQPDRDWSASDDERMAYACIWHP